MLIKMSNKGLLNIFGHSVPINCQNANFGLGGYPFLPISARCQGGLQLLSEMPFTPIFSKTKKIKRKSEYTTVKSIKNECTIYILVFSKVNRFFSLVRDAKRVSYVTFLNHELYRNDRSQTIVIWGT